MKYIKAIISPIIFMILYFVFSYLFVRLTNDSIVSVILTNTCISIVAFLYYKHSISHTIVVYSFKGIFAFFGLLLFIWAVMQHTTSFLYNTFGDAAFDGYTHVSNTNVGLYILLTLVFAPIAEELLMRGILFRKLSTVVPVFIASVISAVIFALLHGTLLHIPVGIFCGVLFSMVYSYTGKLRYAIIFHSLYNFMALFFGNIKFPAFVYDGLYCLCINIALVAILVSVSQIIWCFDDLSSDSVDD